MLVRNIKKAFYCIGYLCLIGAPLHASEAISPDKATNAKQVEAPLEEALKPVDDLAGQEEDVTEDTKQAAKVIEKDISKDVGKDTATENADSLKAEENTDASSKEDQEKKVPNIFGSETKSGSRTEMPMPDHHRSTAKSTTETLVTLTLFMSAMLGVLWYIKRKTRGGLLNSNDIRISSYLSLGNKEKLALIRVKDKEVLIGVTAQQIQNLYTFDADPEHSQSELVQTDNTKAGQAKHMQFKSILGKITNSKEKRFEQDSNE